MDEAPPVELAGAARDTELGISGALSREELLRRRRRRLVQLYSLYRAQYWALADELPAKHREYWWEHGASPVLPDEPTNALPRPPLPLLPENVCGVGPPVNGGGVGKLENFGSGAVAAPAAAGARARCMATKCEAKALPLSQYCFDHILLDPKQQLYKPCAFVMKKSGVPNGGTTCRKPVLRGITPSRCADHDPKSQRLLIEALKNVGIDLPLASKSVPKFSLLISEAVRLIQTKRKLSLNSKKKSPFDQSLK